MSATPATPAAAAGSVRRRHQFGDRIQVFAPHRAHLPPLRPYIREYWARRRFAYELSRTNQKATHFDSALGALWLVLNPLLLGVVYFLLVSVLQGGAGDWVANLGRILIGIFTWYYAQNAMSIGAGSVTAGGGLILNQAFPRALLPLSSVITSFLMFLPSIPVYLVYYMLGSHFDSYEPSKLTLLKTPSAVAHHLPGLNPALLWVPVLLVILTVQIYGLAMIFATMTVYFRDSNKFLQYVLRIWLYLTPVLYDMSRYLTGGALRKLLLYGNPLGPIIGSIVRCWTDGIGPSRTLLLASVGWAVVCFVLGAYFFISRERDFAVRI